MKKGLYEQIIDAGLETALATVGHRVHRDQLDPEESHSVLAEHLGQIVEAVLRRQPAKNRLALQAELFNRLVGVLAEFDPGLAGSEKQLGPEIQQLLAIYDGTRPPSRPDTPASLSSLLTGTRADPSLMSQLKQELATADSVDILCSFIKWSGVGLLRDALDSFSQREGTRLRVLTTSYMGATDVAAVEALAALPNSEVRVSYDTHRTRLHAKAYLFERESGFSTAYIGSANLSRPALTEGLEWTLKATQYADPAIWHKVLGTFQSYWEDPEFEPLDSDKLREALEAERRSRDQQPIIPAFTLRPFQFQQEILDALAADRENREPPYRQLVVAATGTGKTMVAAFDYQQQVRAQGGRYPKLLFVAHRREILQQSLNSFRAVLRDQNFGDFLDATTKPSQTNHLFATVQTLYRRDWLRSLSKEEYDYVVIDETHRSAADSYHDMVNYLQPIILLGLTATPERTDGENILAYFDDRIVSEIRLSDAINRRLIVPFHYYGLADNVDYRHVHWERGGYRVAEIDNLITGDSIRASLIVEQCHKRLASVSQARGLAFCVSVEHAKFMADFFNDSGIPSEALTSKATREVRENAQNRLRRREINFIFVVDLYNEGVDLPDVDTVLFLRPTESLTVFLQQLGRGLRLTQDKDYLTVLDFVGQMHKKFRFDLRLRALMTDPSQDLKREVLSDFPHLPAGCAIELERVAQERVLENIRSSLLAGQSQLVRDIADFESDTGQPLSFGHFLQHYDLTPDDIYRRGCWKSLLVRAGLRQKFEAPNEKLLTDWLRRIAHADDADRLTRWATWLKSGEGDDSLILALLIPLIVRDKGIRSASDAWNLLRENSELHEEAKMLVNWLSQRPGARRQTRPDETGQLPLVLHASYTRDEILSLTGVWSWEKQPAMREGAKHLVDDKIDLFLSTLQKSEKHYSPTTMYEDYALDSLHFHWQSQSTTSSDSPTGLRYINHRSEGYTPVLFVRETPKKQNYATPYVYLGPLDYQSHEGSRPISFIWHMIYPIPARILRMSRRLTTD